MRSPSRRLVSWIAFAAVLTMLFAFTAAAGARSHGHRRCSLGAGPLTPTLSFPCNGRTVLAGHNISFEVRDTNSKAHRAEPFIELSNKKPNRRGRLPVNPGSGGFFAELKAVKGHSSLFAYSPPHYTFPGWWLITPGRYYVQISQVDDRAGRSLNFYSPVSTIYVRR